MYKSTFFFAGSFRLPSFLFLQTADRFCPCPTALQPVGTARNRLPTARNRSLVLTAYGPPPSARGEGTRFTCVKHTS